MAYVVNVIDSIEEKSTSRGPVWEATLADGTKVSTFDEDIAGQLEEFEGQAARLEIETTTKGQYTNHYVNGVEPAPAGAAKTAKKAGRGKTQAAGKSSSGRSSDRTSPPDPTGERIARTSGIKIASDFAIAAELDEPDLELARRITQYILTGDWA